LANLSNLTQLYLSGKSISDLSPLINLSALNQFGIGDGVYTNEKGEVTHTIVGGYTSVKEIRQLLVQPSLRILALHKGMSVPDLDALPRERGLAIYVGRSLYQYVPPRGVG